MNLLLDTHVFFWATMAPSHLSRDARVAVLNDDNNVFVSIASAWEAAIKVGSGKWPEAAPVIAEFETITDQGGFTLLPIKLRHVQLAGLMTAPHRDPFDRLLAGQAVLEDMTVISADPALPGLGANFLW